MEHNTNHMTAHSINFETHNITNSIEKLPKESQNDRSDFSNSYQPRKNASTFESYHRSQASSAKTHNEHTSCQQAACNHHISSLVKSVGEKSCIENSMVNDIDKCGLIILGNAGVGKSFLGNILLGRDVFAHEFSAGSVTHTTEYYEIHVGDLKFSIFNIPGLIEADQNRIDMNKKEIEKAFLTRPNSIILYVFGNQRGRLRDEDIVAFNAINAAYSFRRESLVLVLNDLDKDRPSDYEGTTLVLLRKLLPCIEITEENVCFLNCIDRSNPNQRQYLKEQFLAVIIQFIPTIHRKKQKIQTKSDHLKVEKQRIRKQQANFEAERSKFLTEIKKSQARLDATIAKHQTEAELYEIAIKKQHEEFERERSEYMAELNKLRSKVDRAQREYEKLRGNNSVSEKTLKANEEELNKLRRAYVDLSISIRNLKKKSGCIIL